MKKIIQFAHQKCLEHLQSIQTLFTQEGHEVPVGFHGDKDVTTGAPRIFSDILMLEYTHEFAKIGVRGHSVNLTVSTRKD
ncbi:DUF3231 family protein [Halalkalibacter krulwichiae]|uniref:DUF3231 family protein n=1 Tax=Halalkalibacter krulwichiae TaxID=199441 RepID=UPI0035304960